MLEELLEGKDVRSILFEASIIKKLAKELKNVDKGFVKLDEYDKTYKGYFLWKMGDTLWVTDEDDTGEEVVGAPTNPVEIAISNFDSLEDAVEETLNLLDEVL